MPRGLIITHRLNSEGTWDRRAWFKVLPMPLRRWVSNVLWAGPRGVGGFLAMIVLTIILSLALPFA